MCSRRLIEPIPNGILAGEVVTMMFGGTREYVLYDFPGQFLLPQIPEWQTAVTEEATAVNLAPDHAAESLPKLRLPAL